MVMRDDKTVLNGLNTRKKLSGRATTLFLNDAYVAFLNNPV